MNMLKKVLIPVLILIFTYPIFAGSSTKNDIKDNEYVIRNIVYNINGVSREDVLEHYLDIKSGDSFSDESKLIAFLDDKRQMIKNQRSLAEGKITTKYMKDPNNSDRFFVDLEIYVKDTWNYILLPYARYDSNTGFLLSLRGRNYNFLGSMETLSLNLDYVKPVSGGSEYSINGGLSLPFYLWNYNWKFNFNEDLTISPDDPLGLYTRAGVSLDIPLDTLILNATVDQYFYLNQDGATDLDGYYMRTVATFGSSIPIGLNLSLLGELSYSPGIITSYAYKPFDTLSEDRKGYELGVKHGVTVGRINWQGNFRDGASISADQDLRYNFTRGLWLSNINAEFQYHKAFGWGGISSRLKGFYLYNSTGTDIGEPIRGILDSRLAGDAAVFLNVDFPMKMWIWFLDKWFEGHISPFFDYALVKPNGGNFSLNDGWYSAGLEGFAFLKAARSIYLRMSLGVDLEAILDGASLGDPAPRDGASIYSIFIGLGHHY